VTGNIFKILEHLNEWSLQSLKLLHKNKNITLTNTMAQMHCKLHAYVLAQYTNYIKYVAKIYM
jgi:hypothetical protein